MSLNIILFDIPSPKPIPTSPNTWKVRLALNYKNLQYQTQWVPTTDIESTCKELGIPPTVTKPDGSPQYTLPAIIDRTDPSNPMFLADSLLIIEYLEKTYPPIPGLELIPANTQSFQYIFYQTIVEKQLGLALRDLCVMALYRAKPPGKEQEDFKRRMESRFGLPLESIEKQGEEREQAFRALEETFSLLASSLDRNETGEYLMGQHISFADLALCAWCLTIKTVSPDDVWDRIISWEAGGWGLYVERFGAYMQV